MNPPRPTRAVLRPLLLLPEANEAREATSQRNSWPRPRTCVRVRQAVCCYRWCRRGCLPVSHASIDSTILGPYPLLSNQHYSSTILLPTCEHGVIPRRPGQTLDSALRNHHALYSIYYGIVPPGPSLASRRQRLKHPARTARTAAVLRLAHTATRCRNRPVHDSRRLV